MAVAFLMGCVFPVVMPARQAIVVNIVGRDGLTSSMALQMSAMQASRIVAPVLAGYVIAVSGGSTEPVYAAAICLYAIALIAMSRIHRSPPPPVDAGRSVFGDIFDGFAYVRGDRPVRALLALSLIPILLAMPFQALLVVFAEDVWNTGSRGLGFLQAAAGLGGIIGSAYIAWMGDVDRKMRVMMSSLLAFCGTLFLFAISPWFLLALPLVLIADVFASVFTTVNSTTIQLLIPDEVRGRVMSLMMMTFGLTPLGTVPVSALAEVFGAPFAVAVAALTTLALSAGFLLFVPALRAVDATSREAAASGSPRARFQAGRAAVPSTLETAS
jgi:predicted MFS family arabinose efflux permease